MIRRAIESDTEAVIEMGRRFFATTLYARFADYHEDTVRHLIAQMRETGVLLVALHDERPVGMAGLLLAPFLFDARRKAAYEVMWWVDAEVQRNGIGRALLAAIEPACREAGCAAIQMVRLASSPPEAEHLYHRLGFEPSEFCHTKILEETP